MERGRERGREKKEREKKAKDLREGTEKKDGKKKQEETEVPKGVCVCIAWAEDGGECLGYDR